VGLRVRRVLLGLRAVLTQCGLGFLGTYARRAERARFGGPQGPSPQGQPWVGSRVRVLTAPSGADGVDARVARDLLGDWVVPSQDRGRCGSVFACDLDFDAAPDRSGRLVRQQSSVDAHLLQAHHGPEGLRRARHPEHCDDHHTQ